ncbi:uncharacterized protein PHACADRAFT_248149 [Phanerochaete carnosa HHB-10118-sp]|uniref:Uncharacterized protein n=1 Tax=Phanerochaete carnosa (strain HHB-10118-sp) TaxID=650164 RepID=K5XEJ4_PHACS|nr:uncharacterized protein PHACADRAFT_248149 [Phanerochaete carnosa HHB-10118-sp]EKM61492.1 hypothetical protein PHACADRAFT_248149 [Phanerochaete carnosa HHB-10118-sp]
MQTTYFFLALVQQRPGALVDARPNDHIGRSVPILRAQPLPRAVKSLVQLDPSHVSTMDLESARRPATIKEPSERNSVPSRQPFLHSQISTLIMTSRDSDGDAPIAAVEVLYVLPVSTPSPTDATGTDATIEGLVDSRPKAIPATMNVDEEAPPKNDNEDTGNEEDEEAEIERIFGDLGFESRGKPQIPTHVAPLQDIPTNPLSTMPGKIKPVHSAAPPAYTSPVNKERKPFADELEGKVVGPEMNGQVSSKLDVSSQVCTHTGDHTGSDTSNVTPSRSVVAPEATPSATPLAALATESSASPATAPLAAPAAAAATPPASLLAPSLVESPAAAPEATSPAATAAALPAAAAAVPTEAPTAVPIEAPAATSETTSPVAASKTSRWSQFFGSCLSCFTSCFCCR